MIQLSKGVPFDKFVIESILRFFLENLHTKISGILDISTLSW